MYNKYQKRSSRTYFVPSTHTHSCTYTTTQLTYHKHKVRINRILSNLSPT